uniref:Anaphase-promoting complex subunit 1-like isoform X1 n=2 Tax=Hirondellea gigas TaxID=1518452 RepID=A0A6A7FY93_9CRUS
MICCEDGQEYVPYGRQVMKTHPAYENRRSGNKEWWSVIEHNGQEEELYVHNRTAVWSHGQAGAANIAAHLDNNIDDKCQRNGGKKRPCDMSRSVVCTLTVESSIKQALFTTFFTYSAQPAMLGEHIADHPTGAPLYSLCVLEKEYLTVYTEEGEEFSISLPFAVEKAWSIWYGLLLQRKVNSTEADPPHPILFSLLHPLEEISPINQKTGSSNALLPCYGVDLQQSVIMTSQYPSLVITHSSKHNSVSVWRARRCNMEENAAMVHNCSYSNCRFSYSNVTTNLHNQSFSGTLPMNQHLSPAPLHFTPSRSLSRNHHTTLNFTPSGTMTQQQKQQNLFTPTNQFNTPATTLNFTSGGYCGNNNNSLSYLASPAGLSPANKRSPIVGAVKTPVNARLRNMLGCPDKHTPRQQQQPPSQGTLFARTPSPSCMSQHIKLGRTPSPHHSTLRTAAAAPPTPSAQSILDDPVAAELEPLIPDLCLDLLWTDQTATKPRKVFLSEDCVGQRFLCLVLQDTVRVIKYEHTNDMGSLVFGSCSTIPAQDASPMLGLKMVVTVDPSGSLTLYSGLMLVCKIHVTQSTQALNTTLFKDFSSLNISCQLFNSVATPLRRSSLIASNRPPSAIDNKFEVLFSPVLSEKPSTEKLFSNDQCLPESASARALHDPTINRVTVEHTNGVMHRITFPDMCSSSLVSRVLAAFKYILPRDTALHFIAKWYSTRNSPGSGNFAAQGEWFLFSRTLLTMIGYDTDKLQATCPMEQACAHSPAAVQKKVKTTDNGSDKDWQYVLSSQYHRQSNSGVSEVLELDWVGSISEDKTDIKNCNLNESSPLFQHMPAIFYSLHLLYEELKCCTLYWDLCALLVPCLSQLAADLRTSTYLHHYWKDFPTICSPDGPVMHLSEQQLNKIIKPGYFTDIPPNFLATLLAVMKGTEFEPFPYIPDVCPLIKSILLIYCVAASDCSLKSVPIGKYLRRISPSGQKAPEPVRSVSLNVAQDAPRIHEKVVLLTDSLGLTNLDVQLLAPGLSLLLMNAQHRCRINPPLGWCASTYKLINRPDMVKHSHQAAQHAEKLYKISQDAYSAPAQYDGFISSPKVSGALYGKYNEERNKLDGMDNLDWSVLRLRWATDKRINEVRQMLNSATPVVIDIKQRPEASDHEFIEEQERYLFSLCIRTMALPIGRGMFTLSTLTPVITETLVIPPLTLSGRAAPRGTSVDLTNIEVPPNMNMWPLFHNGVASALKIHPSSEDLDTSWILYNRPKTGSDSMLEHAGFLMGLGLTGHLKNLNVVGLHEYLGRAHELTSVGLLLGLAAARRGTCHSATTKLLSIHLECLLPPTCTELDIHHTVQVASILGIGLLYQGSGHRHMAEVLLREIGRPPGPEMENSNDRESYSLAAGLGLGLVMFGKGIESDQFADLDIAGQLYHYIEGGYQKPMTGPTRDKYKSPSYQIKEGKRVNIDVTSPGATLALGMIYFKSNNKAVAQWMLAPQTTFLLDQIRPDFLLLRTVSLGLIMWDDVIPSSKWVEKNIPCAVLKHTDNYEDRNVDEPNVDYETMYQAFFNLVAGSCLVLGLKFAGSANDDAFQVIYKYTTMLFRCCKSSCITIVAGKCSLESCLCVALLSISMVMAGSGDLEVLRLIRCLRERVGPLNTSVGYGSHVAIHMSLGFLFLGGGRFTLSTDHTSVAALLIACFPKMPQHSGDNRYQLQAFRHLYVLACEPRLLMPVDVDTGMPVSTNITVKFSACNEYSGESYQVMSPVMLPELSRLQEVCIETHPHNDRYWPLRFSRKSKTWAILEALLRGGYGVAVKLREGEAPHPPVLPTVGNIACATDSSSASGAPAEGESSCTPMDGGGFSAAVTAEAGSSTLTGVAISAVSATATETRSPGSNIDGCGVCVPDNSAGVPTKITTLRADQPPPWIAQSAELMGIGGDTAAELLKVLLGVDISSINSAGAPSSAAGTSSPSSSNARSSCSNTLPAAAAAHAMSDGAGYHSNAAAADASCPNERALHQLLTSVVYDHLALGKPEAIANWLTVIQGMKKIAQLSQHSGLLVWQVKLIHSVANFLCMLSSRDHSNSRRRRVTTDQKHQKFGAPTAGREGAGRVHSVLCQPTLAVTAAADKTADNSAMFDSSALEGASLLPIHHSSISVTPRPLPSQRSSGAAATFTASAAATPTATATNNIYISNDESLLSNTGSEDSFFVSQQLGMEVSCDDDQMHEEEEAADDGVDTNNVHVTAVAAPRQLVAPDQAISLRSRLAKLVDSWSKDVNPQLVQYLRQDSTSGSSSYSAKTALTLLLLDVPHPSLLQTGARSKLQLARQLHQLGVSAAVIQQLIAAEPPEQQPPL